MARPASPRLRGLVSAFAAAVAFQRAYPNVAGVDPGPKTIETKP